MKTIKPQGLGVLHRAYEDGGRFFLSVGILSFFPLDEPKRLLTEVALWKFVAAELGKDATIDIGLPKPRGELLLSARGYAPGGVPTPSYMVRAALGPIDKTLVLTGDRFFRMGGMTLPIPFVEMPIAYERAYGGPGYAENPLGKGFGELDANSPRPVPNIEAPHQRMRGPQDRLAPAGFGPIDFTWPQRAQKAGTYDELWFKQRFPGFAADMDWSIFNAAPPDQQIDGFFSGDEAFSLSNLHPSRPQIAGRLPELNARCFITRRQDGADAAKLREVPTQLETVWLFPHAERGLLLYRGIVEVAEDDAADVVHMVVAGEQIGNFRPLEHYAQVLEKRLHKERGHLFALQDGPLMPTPDFAAAEKTAAAAPPAMEMEPLLKTENLMAQNFARRAARAQKEARQQIAAMGMDPDAVLGPETSLLNELAPLRDVEQLPTYLEKVEALLERKLGEAELAKIKAEAQARLLCEKEGLVYEKIMNPDGQGGPPQFSATEEIAKLHAVAQSARQAGAPLGELEDMLQSPQFADRLHHAERNLRQMYIQAAHHFPAAAPMPPAQVAILRKEVAAKHDLAFRNLTGADLCGLNLNGVNLQGALLEGAKLTGTSLRDANLQGAVLARSDLSNADLRGADLRGANLGEAHLRGTQFHGANLRNAILFRAILRNTAFCGADLSDVNFLEADIFGLDLSQACAPHLLVVRANLSGLRAAQADLREATFIETTLTDADFAGANLTSAVFLQAQGERTSFQKANLQNLRVVQNSSFENADFAEAVLDGANLRGTRLVASSFKHCRLSGTDLSECNLQRADLCRVLAISALLIRADLTDAKLRAANLMQALLSKAILCGSDFSGANLFRADFLRARMDERTSFDAANLTQSRTSKEKPHAPR